MPLDLRARAKNYLQRRNTSFTYWDVTLWSVFWEVPLSIMFSWFSTFNCGLKSGELVTVHAGTFDHLGTVNTVITTL